MPCQWQTHYAAKASVQQRCRADHGSSIDLASINMDWSHHRCWARCRGPCDWAPCRWRIDLQEYGMDQEQRARMLAASRLFGDLPTAAHLRLAASAGLHRYRRG